MALAEAPMPFRPKQEQAEWRMVYGHLATMKIGDVVTYEELDSVLGRDFRADRAPLYRAVREVEAIHSRSFTPVRGKGYRMVEPEEHIQLVTSRMARGRRQVRRGREVADATDLSAIKDPAIRQHVEELRLVTRRHESMLHQQNLRLHRLERTLEDGQQKTEKKLEKVDALIEALKRHGIDIDT